MKNDDLMKRMSDLMQSSELIFVKGQIRNIAKAIKDDKSVYYLADVRIPRNNDFENIYGVSFNVIHICFSSEFVKESNITDEIMKTYKDNEVLLNLNISSAIKSIKAKDNNVFKVNDIKFFVDDILLLKSIVKPSYSEGRKVVNL